MHVFHTDRKVCTHMAEPGTPSQTHSCTDTCVYCHMYACKQKWASVPQGHTQTKSSRDIAEHIGKIPVHRVLKCTQEHKHLHVDTQMHSPRESSKDISSHADRLMQTHTHTCAHRHEDGHTDIHIQPEVEEQMYEQQGMHVWIEKPWDTDKEAYRQECRHVGTWTPTPTHTYVMYTQIQRHAEAHTDEYLQTVNMRTKHDHAGMGTILYTRSLAEIYTLKTGLQPHSCWHAPKPLTGTCTELYKCTCLYRHTNSHANVHSDGRHPHPEIHRHRTSSPYKSKRHTHMHACVLSHFSCAQLFATLWTVALQAPLSVGFSRQEY